MFSDVVYCFSRWYVSRLFYVDYSDFSEFIHCYEYVEIWIFDW